MSPARRPEALSYRKDCQLSSPYRGSRLGTQFGPYELRSLISVVKPGPEVLLVGGLGLGRTATGAEAWAVDHHPQGDAIRSITPVWQLIKDATSRNMLCRNAFR